MIPIIGPWLVKRALGWAFPSWAAKLFGAVVPIAVAALLFWGGWSLLTRHLEGKGAAKVERRVERDHAARVTEARSDERAIAATGNRIAARAARTDADTTEFVTARLKDINDALQSPPPAGAAADAAVFDGGAVRSSVNSVVDRANRAAEAADAAE